MSSGPTLPVPRWVQKLKLANYATAAIYAECLLGCGVIRRATRTLQSRLDPELLRSGRSPAWKMTELNRDAVRLAEELMDAALHLAARHEDARPQHSISGTVNVLVN